MDIQTKFEIGSEIWFMEDNVPKKAEVKGIQIEVYPQQYEIITIVTYKYGYMDRVINEKRCYPSKRDLVESFLNE